MSTPPDTVSQADFQQLTDKLTHLLTISFDGIRSSLATTQDQNAHEINALHDALNGGSRPKGPPGATKAPIFKGDRDDALVFLEQYALYGKFYNWTDEESFDAFPLSLTGSALIWYSTIDKTQFTNLEGLIKTFRERFLSTTDNWLLRNELAKRKQGANESLSDYAVDIRKRCQRLLIPPVEQLHVFVQGLKEELRNYVVLQQPQNLEEAENFAKIKNSVGEATTQSLTVKDVVALQRDLIEQLQNQNLLSKPRVAAFDYSHEQTSQREQRPQADSKPQNHDLRRIIQEELRSMEPNSYNSRPYQNYNSRQYDNDYHQYNSYSSRPMYRDDFGRNRTSKNIVCFNCQRKGHHYKTCRAAPRQLDDYTYPNHTQSNRNNQSHFQPN